MPGNGTCCEKLEQELSNLKDEIGKLKADIKELDASPFSRNWWQTQAANVVDTAGEKPLDSVKEIIGEPLAEVLAGWIYDWATTSHPEPTLPEPPPLTRPLTPLEIQTLNDLTRLVLGISADHEPTEEEALSQAIESGILDAYIQTWAEPLAKLYDLGPDDIDYELIQTQLLTGEINIDEYSVYRGLSFEVDDPGGLRDLLRSLIWEVKDERLTVPIDEATEASVPDEQTQRKTFQAEPVTQPQLQSAIDAAIAPLSSQLTGVQAAIAGINAQLGALVARIGELVPDTFTEPERMGGARPASL